MSPDIVISTRLYKIVLLAFSGDFANKTKTKHKTTISVHVMNSCPIRRSIIQYNVIIRRSFFQ